jgi:nitrogen fixation/metabolism regulation signal transduction histidine kinase
LRLAADGAVDPGVLARIEEARDDADVTYLRERIPEALKRWSAGVGHISEIVGAMRAFAHPPSLDTAMVDVNAAVGNALIVARNEYKYVADVSTDLGELPAVECNPGELGQALLNLIINAAHAIADVVGESTDRGAIQVGTRVDGDEVAITIGTPAAASQPA